VFQYFKFSFFAILIVATCSCHEKNNNNSSLVREEMRSREVIHLTQNQIAERAFELGDTILTEAESLFLSELQMAKDSSCIPAFDSMAIAMQDEYKSKISRYPFERKKWANNSSKKEIEVLDAYLYSHNNKIPISPNYQKDGEKDFIFNKALVLNQNKCLSCHAKIKNPFLQGKIGDTIGIWSAKYSKKMVIMSYVD
jgi:hypothetical protein